MGKRQQSTVVLSAFSIYSNVGDGDNLLFTVRGSPRPVSWLGSRTESVIAAMAGDWYRYQIRKPRPIVTVVAMIYCPFVSTINGDDHNFMFIMCASPRTVSWLGVTPSNYKFNVCGMQKGARKAARTGLGDAIVQTTNAESESAHNLQSCALEYNPDVCQSCLTM
nr:hypothetical protein [Tanacetum cinerariifolium]